MTFRLSGAIAVLAVIALPALAQTPTPPSSQNSGVGITGQPGGKNGPAPNPTANNDQKNPTTQLQDTSKIQGKPGSKSGSAVKPPSKQYGTGNFSRMFVVTPVYHASRLHF